MKLKVTISVLLVMAMFAACNADKKSSGTQTMDFKQIPVTYPLTRQDTTVSNDYFGSTISDPYRWLEDDQSAETKDWVTKQNIVTNGYLSQIPYREQVKKRLEDIFNYERYTAPFKEGGKYYFFKNDGLQNQSVLYVQETLNSQAEIVLDPNKFSADGTTSLGELDFSKDGRYLAYSTSVGGSDWRTIVVKDLQTGTMLADQIDWVKFSGISWQGNGFFYTRFPEPKKGDELKGANKLGAVYYHALGTPQSADKLVYHDKAHPDRSFGAGTTDDERFLYVTGWESTSGNALFVKDLTQGNAQFAVVSETFEKDYNVVDNIGEKLLVLTNDNAPNQRLILIDPTKPTAADWQTLIAEDPNDVLQGAAICGGKIVCTYLHNASSSLRVFNLDGSLIKEVTLPEIGSVGGISGKPNDPLAFFSFTSFLRPGTVYSLDMNSLAIQVFKAPKIDFNPDLYMTEQVWYESKDGLKVPMFITRKKMVAFDGQNPTLLYGYGGFNISVTPTFSPSKAALLENNGIYAVANIRGGGEFGEKWHKAGTKCQKQNVFDDFIAAAEFLIQKKYTSPARLAIQGGSNGGLLVGACMTQRPDLFGVCFPQVGVLDMLRYHQFTIGYAWATDYGRSDNPEEFKCLVKYSPLHNVKKTAYPATMVTTADHDDRVVPAHSFKFAAAVQEHQQGSNPVLIRIETSAGHGAGKPTAKIIEEAADMLSFMLYNMKMQVIYGDVKG
ncbi:MAG: S9 family peptidase [Saprospiraceae bacterium]|nr:S9 family peptidase [Saprospiraceae bacterium]